MSALTARLLEVGRPRHPGCYRPLGELATQIRDTVLPDKSDERPYLALEHIDKGDIVPHRHGRPADARSSKFVFRRGDVLYGKLRPYLDKAVLAPFDGLASTELIVLRAKPDVDPRFLALALHSPRVLKRAIETTTGVNHPRTSWESLRRLDVYCPPIEEQRRIARILSSIRHAKDSTERAEAAASQLAIFGREQLFTELECHKVALGELVSDVRNGLYKPHATYGPVGTPIVRINDFPNTGGRIDSSPLRVALTGSESDHWQLTHGDILVNRVNSLSHIGKAALVCEPKERLVYESNMMRLRLDQQRVLPDYLFEFLRTQNARAFFFGSAKRAVAQSSINQGDVSALRVPLPSMAVQNTIARRIRTIENASNSTKRLVAVLESVLGAVLYHLFEPAA